MGIMALGGKNEICSRYLDLPNCREFSHSSYLCHKNKACIWNDPEPMLNKTLVLPGNPANATFEYKKGSQKRKNSSASLYPTQKDGMCLTNWVHSMLVVDEVRLKSNKVLDSNESV